MNDLDHILDQSWLQIFLFARYSSSGDGDDDDDDNVNGNTIFNAPAIILSIRLQVCIKIAKWTHTHSGGGYHRLCMLTSASYSHVIKKKKKKSCPPSCCDGPNQKKKKKNALHVGDVSNGNAFLLKIHSTVHYMNITIDNCKP